MRYKTAIFLALFSVAANAQMNLPLPQIVPENEDTTVEQPVDSGSVLSEQPAQVDVAPTIDDAYSPYRHSSSPIEPAPDASATDAPVVTPPAAVEKTPEEPAAPVTVDAKKATIQILDKLNAKALQIDVEVGKKLKHNELEIELKRCVHSPKEAKEENIAFMRIWDLGKGDYSNEVFKGWMFSSNPALHTLEHPIYDVVLLKCFQDKN